MEYQFCIRHLDGHNVQKNKWKEVQNSISTEIKDIFWKAWIKPLQFEKINLECGLSGYAINGTPADAVKCAMNIIMEKKPDILVSGINPGSNVGQSILYSGTVSAAREGSFRGVDSIAISLDSIKDPDYSTSKTISKKIVQCVLKNRLPSGTFLNVTIPNIS